MVTMQEEAQLENFNEDIKKMAKEIASALNALLSREDQVSAIDVWITDKDERKIRIGLGGYAALRKDAKPSNPKLKWEIKVIGTFYNDVDFRVPVSHRDAYVKKELERARNSILKKLEELINQNA